MTTTERMQAERATVEAQIRTLTRKQYEITLAIEEAEERPESRDARYARAYLAGDYEALHRICVEGAIAFHETYGAYPSDDIRNDAERLRSASEGAEAQG